MKSLACALTVALLLLLPTAVAAQRNTGIVENASFGCAKQETYRQGARLLSDGDMEALTTFLMEEDCALIKEGDTVRIGELALLRGLICVRPRGKTKCYWTAYENIKSGS